VRPSTAFHTGCLCTKLDACAGTSNLESLQAGGHHGRLPHRDTMGTTTALPTEEAAALAVALKPSPAQAISDALAIGIINTIVTLPVTLAYVSIMFPSARFRPFMSSLAKLVFFGSSVHQLSFSLFSSLPFAIGQVQDVGLIFLSAMSTRVVQSLVAQGKDDDMALVTTTLVSMTLSTTIVGVLLILVGKCDSQSHHTACMWDILMLRCRCYDQQGGPLLRAVEAPHAGNRKRG
jgi:hypothetical protein